MPLKKSEIESKFSGKFFFQKIPNTGRNPHERWAFYYNEKKIASTGFSRSFRDNDDINDDLLRIMAKEIRVQTLHNFKGMITCTVNRDQYIDILKQQGFIQDKKTGD